MKNLNFLIIILFIVFSQISCDETRRIDLNFTDLEKSGTNVADYFESSGNLWCIFDGSLDLRGLPSGHPILERAGYVRGFRPGSGFFPCPERWAFVHQALFKWNLDDLVSELDDGTEILNAELILSVNESENTCPPEVGDRCKCVLSVFAATEDWSEGFTFDSFNDNEISKIKRAEVGGWGVETRSTYIHTFPGLTGYVKDWVNGTRENHGLIIQPARHPLPGGNLRVELNNNCIVNLSDLQTLRVWIGRSR